MDKGDDRADVDGLSPWWHQVSTYTFQSAWADADRAWQAWLDSLAGRRAGRAVGYPRFKKKGRTRDAFRLHHDVKRPTIRSDGYRRLLLPRLGSIRVHGTLKPLVRVLDRGQGRVQSVTITRGAHHWYAQVLVAVTDPAALTPGRTTPLKPTVAQQAAGTVGVDVGVAHLAALSDGTLIDNPRHTRRSSRRLRRAQRVLARTQRGSNRRARAARKVARIQHETAERRAGVLHALTKRLATSWAAVAVEDLHVAGMTRSAAGTIDQPGTNVRAKAGLNRSILDASFGEIRRQLTYKTRWYGSALLLANRWAPTSKTCSSCGWRNPSLTLRDRTFHCQSCDLALHRDVNPARNIAAAGTDPEAWHASVAPARYRGDENRPPRGDPEHHRDRLNEAARPRTIRSEVTPAQQ